MTSRCIAAKAPAMSRLAIKICGLSTADTVGAAVRAGASHIGFVHFSKSPRHVDTGQTRALATIAPLVTVVSQLLPK